MEKRSLGRESTVLANIGKIRLASKVFWEERPFLSNVRENRGAFCLVLGSQRTTTV